MLRIGTLFWRGKLLMRIKIRKSVTSNTIRRLGTFDSSNTNVRMIISIAPMPVTTQTRKLKKRDTKKIKNRHNERRKTSNRKRWKKIKVLLR